MFWRYSTRSAGSSRSPCSRSWGAFGAQTPPPERAAEPPMYFDFSITSVSSPSADALRAEAIPPAPAPTTTTSTSLALTAGTSFYQTVDRRRAHERDLAGHTPRHERGRPGPPGTRVPRRGDAAGLQPGAWRGARHSPEHALGPAGGTARARVRQPGGGRPRARHGADAARLPDDAPARNSRGHPAIACPTRAGDRRDRDLQRRDRQRRRAARP